MPASIREKSSAASGLGALVLGAAGGALEKGWPNLNDSRSVASFVVRNRSAIVGQSLCFLLSAALLLWFISGLRSILARAERPGETLSTVAFGGGIAWIALNMMAQAFQLGVAMAPDGEVETPLLLTATATFGIANLPLAAMLAATAGGSFLHRALPVWLGWLSIVAATSQLALFFGAVWPRGPLAPNGWLTYLLYPAFAAWLLPTAVVMMWRGARLAEAHESVA